MADYDAIVIGAGNGGLTAATTLARSGVKTLLLEQHNVPGGAATSFCRGRFEFEVSLHQLSGLGTEKSPGPLRDTFAKLGVLDKLHFVEEHDIYRSWVPGRLDITLPADRAGIIDVLVSRFPGEREGINGLFDLIYKFSQEMSRGILGRDPEFSADKYPVFCNFALQDSDSVMSGFLKDPLLKLAIASYWPYVGHPPKQMSFLDLAFMLFLYVEYKPHHFKGGSQALSQALLDSFLEAGGTARFSCGARKIVVENGKVRAVVTDHGDEIEAGFVISNASLLTTYMDMIGADNLPAEAMAALKPHTIGPSAITAYCGLDCLPADIGIKVSSTFASITGNVETMFGSPHRFDKPEGLELTCYDLADPDFSPPGTCQVSLINLSYADHWLRLPPESYHETKYEYASQMLDIAERMHPGFRAALEEVEVATPLTHMNYLRSPGGSIYGFDQYAKDNNMFGSHRSPLKGLFHTGAWAGMGGFQPSLESGVQAAKAVVRAMNR
jgi:prolycopene isomerase